MNRKILVIAAVAAWWYSFAAQAAVEKSQRSALVVVELAESVDGQLKTLYQTIENLAVKQAVRLETAYAEVTVLRSEDATLEGMLKALTKLASRKENRTVDLYLNLHGSEGSVTFRGGAKEMKDVRDAVRNVKALAGKLRAVYSTACYGRTHAQDWLDAGFRVASGAMKINTNAAYETPKFIDSWSRGDDFQTSIEKGDDPRWRKFYDDIAANFGFPDADSKKEVYGDGKLTISAE